MEYLVDVVPWKRLPRSLRFFTYRLNDAQIPPAACSGAFVRIPFRNKPTDAIVWQQRAKKPVGVRSLLSITSVLSAPALTKQQRQMLTVFADQYAISLGHAAYRMLPQIPRRRAAARSEKRSPAPLLKASVSRLQQILALRTRMTGKQPLFLPAAQLAERVGAVVAATRRRQGQQLIVVPTVVALDQFRDALNRPLAERLVVLDPRLSLAAYWERWVRIGRQPNVVVLSLSDGLFAPLQHLTTIIVSQASDPQYQHAEQNPRFQTITLVHLLSRCTSSTVLMLDVAPTLAIASLPHLRVLPLPPLTQDRRVIDLQEERARKNFAPLADAPYEHVAGRRERVLFFLNRRGARRTVHCSECGWTAQCPRCRLPRILHSGGLLQCHHCGLSVAAPLQCPQCGNVRFTMTGMGTQHLAAYLQARFPDRPVERIDRDSHVRIVSEAPDALVAATERILYLPAVLPFTTIIHVQVDTLLQVADYRVEEQAYLLCERVCSLGRPGATVFLQTYHPQQQLVRALAQRTWREFYARELAIRRSLQLPPAVRLVKLIGKAPTSAAVEEHARNVRKQLQAMVTNVPEISVEGPLLPQPEREGRWYRRFLLLRVLSGKQQLATLHRVVRSLPDAWLVEVDPVSLLQ